MSRIETFLRSMYSVILTMKITDFLDIALLAYVIYYVFKFARETRAGQLVKGILFLLGAYIIAHQFDMRAMAFLLRQAFDIGLLAIFIVFQPEIRRAVEKIGHSHFGLKTLNLVTPSDDVNTKWARAIDAICDACVDLSTSCTGALIVIERNTKLGEQIDNGTILNAQPSKELFGNIFYPKAPLHDGAVIMRDGMVLAAACFLPKPQDEERIDKKLGSRHRAAIGMSENSDALVVVVSEETGQISITEAGEIDRNYTRDKLHHFLTDRLIPKQPDGKKIRLSRRKGKEERHGKKN